MVGHLVLILTEERWKTECFALNSLHCMLLGN